MTGIYKITNKINGNAYVGLSVDIEKRWKTHLQRYLEDGPEYNKVLYKAMRKYGVDNFSFEVLEICEAESLVEREEYWIDFYDTFHNGYNATPGGILVSYQKGEAHHNHKLTENDVRYIRELWASKTISTREMYYEFQNRIGKTGFKKIYTWQTWKDILPELNTEENRKWHRENLESYKNKRKTSGVRALTSDEVRFIREKRKEGRMPKSVWEEYNYGEKIGYDGFKDVWYGRTYKDVI